MGKTTVPASSAIADQECSLRYTRRHITRHQRERKCRKESESVWQFERRLTGGEKCFFSAFNTLLSIIEHSAVFQPYIFLTIVKATFFLTVECAIGRIVRGALQIHLLKPKKVKAVYSASWETHLRATGASLAISDHTALPATRHKWMRPP